MVGTVGVRGIELVAEWVREMGHEVSFAKNLDPDYACNRFTVGLSGAFFEPVIWIGVVDEYVFWSAVPLVSDWPTSWKILGSLNNPGFFNDLEEFFLVFYRV